MGRVLPKLCPSEALLRDGLGRTWKGNGCDLRSFLEEAVVLIEGGVLNVAEALPAENAAAVPVGQFFSCTRCSKTLSDGTSAARWSAPAGALRRPPNAWTSVAERFGEKLNRLRMGNGLSTRPMPSLQGAEAETAYCGRS